MPKSDKEIAAELMCAYLAAIYSRGNVAAITPDVATDMYQAFYNAVISVNETQHSN